MNGDRNKWKLFDNPGDVNEDLQATLKIFESGTLSALNKALPCYG